MPFISRKHKFIIRILLHSIDDASFLDDLRQIGLITNRPQSFGLLLVAYDTNPRNLLDEHAYLLLTKYLLAAILLDVSSLTLFVPLVVPVVMLNPSTNPAVILPQVTPSPRTLNGAGVCPRGNFLKNNSP